MITAEQASPRLDQASRRDALSLRFALFMGLYAACYVALDRSAVLAQMWPGISAWYLPAGLSVALFLAAGFRMVPLGVFSGLTAAALNYHMPFLSWGFLPQTLAIVLGYASAAVVLRSVWPIDPGLRTLRDATRFVLVMLGAAAVVAALGALTSVAAGLVPQSQLGKAIFNWWVGDSVAIMSFTPFLLVYVVPWVRLFLAGTGSEQAALKEDERTGPVSPLEVLEQIAQFAAIAAAIWLVFAFAPASRYEPLYAFFIPIIWVAGRHGLRGAAASSLLLNVGVMFGAHFGHAEIDGLARLQLVMLTVALTALFLGSVVSERQRALGALRESKESLRSESRLLESVLDSIGDGVVVADENGKYLQWNPSAERILGLWRVGAWPEPERRGLYLSDAVTPFPTEDLPLARAVRGEATDGVEIFVRHDQQPGIWTSATGRPICDRQGKIHGGVAVFRDVTKRKQAEEDYRKAQDRLSGIYSCSLDAMAYVGLDGTLLEVNDAFLALTGYSREELVERLTYQSITPAEYAAAEAARVNDLLRTGRAQEYEKEYVRKNGSRVPTLITIFPVTGKDGRPTGIGAVIKDVTERKRAEMFRAGQNQVLEMIATGAPLEQMLSALARLLESQCEGMLSSVLLFEGERLKHGAAPSLPAAYIEAVDRMPMGSGTGSCGGTAAYVGEQVIVADILDDPLWAKCRDLAVRHGLRACWSTPIKSHEGRVVGALTVYHREPRTPTANEMQLIDIASRLAGIGIERKQVEEELRQSEERFSKAFRASPAAVSISTLREGRYVDINESCMKIFGYERGEMVGGSATELVWVDPEDRLRFVKALEREKLIRGMEVKLRSKSGQLLDAVLSAELVHLGAEPCVLVITEDVTERKRAEEALRQRTLELERSNGDLEQFAYVASHDLQEPLRMVASFTQLLGAQYKGRLDAEADEYIGFAVEGATRMQALIDGLLDFSRVQTRAKALQPTDCQAAFDCSLKNLKVAVYEARAQVTCDPLPTVLADRSQMEQLFQNLVGNAVKFRGHDDPRVHIGARRNGKEWIFSVKDNGIGIDPRHQDRIFAIFQRLHTRKAYPGTGIGLAVCKKIVERHGGRIWVDSAEGQGTTFYFTMPIAEGLE